MPGSGTGTWMAQDPEPLEEEPQQSEPAEARWLSLCPLSSIDMTFVSLPPPTLTRIPLMANPDLEHEGSRFSRIQSHHINSYHNPTIGDFCLMERKLRLRVK